MLTAVNNTVAQKPSVVDAIIKQGVSTAPLVAMLGTGSIGAPTHSWINDRYSDASDKAALEVSDLNENVTPTKAKTSNHSQIIINEVGVSKRQMAMSQYGEKEWPYQVAKKGKEHLKDIEYALLGLGHSGGVESAPVAMTDSVAGRMAGLFYFVPTEQRYLETGVDPADSNTFVDLTMDRLHAFLEPLWTRGAMEDDTFTVLLGSKLKKKINDFGANYLIKKASGESRFDPTIQEIVTDFGIIKLRLHRQFAGAALSDKMLAGKYNEARIMYVDRTEFDTLPTSKTAKFGRYYTDATLEVKNGDMFASAKGLK